MSNITSNNTNVQSLEVTKLEFFTSWLIILQPFLKIRNKEIVLLSRLLYYNYEISKLVKDKDMARELLFSSKTKKQIMADLDLKDYELNNLLSSLRKKNIIVDNNINSKVIPRVSKDFKSFNLVFNFNIKL